MSKDKDKTPSDDAKKEQKKMADNINKDKKKGHKFKNKNLDNLREKGML